MTDTNLKLDDTEMWRLGERRMSKMMKNASY
jgi:hypothetical protein